MDWFCDGHTHSAHSFDGHSRIADMARAAEDAGLKYICFADHLEFEYQPWNIPFDPAAQRRDVLEAREKVNIKLAYGAEIGLTPDPAYAKQGWEHIKDFDPDLVIGSLHIVDGTDVFEPPYFKGKTREQAYCNYLGTVLAAIKTLPQISVVGHYDFVCKRAPFEDRAMHLCDARDVFDELFSYIIQNGIGLEINTAVWQQSDPWGLDILKYYAQKGGEFVTFGSDAHVPQKVGSRINEARELALAAGIKYTAVYEKLKPTFIRL